MPPDSEVGMFASVGLFRVTTIAGERPEKTSKR
jgi:hypothetical protein